MKFFFDNCVSGNLVRALRCLDGRFEMVHLREKFDQDARDEEWLPALGSEGGWIVVSGDPRISRGQAEKAAWIESGLTVFFCGDAWASRKLFVQASEMMRWWDTIVDLGKKAPRGAGFILEFKSKAPRQIYPASAAAKGG